MYYRSWLSIWVEFGARSNACAENPNRVSDSQKLGYCMDVVVAVAVAVIHNSLNYNKYLQNGKGTQIGCQQRLKVDPTND